MCVNKITKSEYPESWDDIIDDAYACSYSNHRRGSSFWKKFVYEINEKYFPELPRELDGFWESEKVICSDDYGCEDPITELTRVEKREKLVKTYEWVPVNELGENN